MTPGWHRAHSASGHRDTVVDNSKRSGHCKNQPLIATLCCNQCLVNLRFNLAFLGTNFFKAQGNPICFKKVSRISMVFFFLSPGRTIIKNGTMWKWPKSVLVHVKKTTTNNSLMGFVFKFKKKKKKKKTDNYYTYMFAWWYIQSVKKGSLKAGSHQRTDIYRKGNGQCRNWLSGDKIYLLCRSRLLRSVCGA